LRTLRKTAIAMTRTDEDPQRGSDPGSDRALWQKCRTTDAPEDEALRFLDLAAFADRLLDVEEQERVAAWLADHPEAAADVRAARALDVSGESPAKLENVIARACAILPPAPREASQVIELARPRGPRFVQSFAQWGSLAAAIAVASWLGFAMGSDATLALSQPRQPSDSSFLPELFDPASGFLRDLGEGTRT
jgi:anti-sigma factor RsiW